MPIGLCFVHSFSLYKVFKLHYFSLDFLFAGSISAVSTAMFNSIAVATSSGSIKFSCIENYEDVHKEISKLLIDRQNAGKSTIIVEKETVADKDIAAELKKYNELLKEGIITQDEFDAKKKQLLEL